MSRSSSLPSLSVRLSPYCVSLKADGERVEAEARVRQQVQQRQRRQEERKRELMRHQVVQAALEEARKAVQPLETVVMLEQQKRLRAFDQVQKVDDKYAAARADLTRRFYEPTLQEREERDARWHHRRVQHQVQRETLRSHIQVVEQARAALLASDSESRITRARSRADAAWVQKASAATLRNGGRSDAMLSAISAPSL